LRENRDFQDGSAHDLNDVEKVIRTMEAIQVQICAMACSKHKWKVRVCWWW